MIHKTYIKGEKYKHTAVRETDVSNILNDFGYMGMRPEKRVASDNGVLMVCNITDKVLVAGTGIVLTGMTNKAKDVYFCKPPDGNAELVDGFGILTEPIRPKEAGYAVFLGVAVAKVDETTVGDYCQIAQDGTGRLIRASSGYVMLNPQKDGEKKIILVGLMEEKYSGPFAVTLNSESTLDVNAGFMIRNGWDFVTVPAKKGIALPKVTSHLCACSTINGNTWTTPEVKFETPARDAYPVACVHVDGSRKWIEPYYTTVAVIMMATPCIPARIGS